MHHFGIWLRYCSLLIWPLFGKTPLSYLVTCQLQNGTVRDECASGYFAHFSSLMLQLIFFLGFASSLRNRRCLHVHGTYWCITLSLAYAVGESLCRRRVHYRCYDTFSQSSTLQRRECSLFLTTAFSDRAFIYLLLLLFISYMYPSVHPPSCSLPLHFHSRTQ